MVTKSKSQTQKLASQLAKKILRITSRGLRAKVIALSGELGSGKTTFVQGFIKALGVKQHITSPTFVIIRRYSLSRFYFLNSRFSSIYHFDLYRIHKSKELLDLGFKKIIAPPTGGPQNIVLIEWPEKIKKLLPKNTIWIEFCHGKKENERIIKIKS